MSDMLLEATLRATLIAAAAGAALWLLRVRAAAVRHRVWTVVMLAMLALPLWTAYGPEIALRVLPTSSIRPAAAAPQPALDVPIGEAETAAGARTASAAADRRAERTAAPSATAAWSWRAWLLAIYVAGAAALLARLAIGTARVTSLVREASIVNGRLTSARIATPFTIGLRRPKVLLPEGWDGWSAERLAAVLDHEQMHVARRDPLVQWLALLNRALFWFHPLAWWLERHLAALAEEACDGAVLARGHGPADYAAHLLDLARMAGRRPMSRAIGMPMPGRMLPTRIAKILDGDVVGSASRKAVTGAAAMAALAASVIGTITLGQERTLAQEPSAQPAQAAAAPRDLLEVYELALENDRSGRESEAARQALLIRVADAYLAVLAAEDRVAAEEAARASMSRSREQAERRFEVGLVSITEVVEARAESDRAVAGMLGAERALAAAQANLREIAGEDVGELSRLIEDVPSSLPDPTVPRPIEPEAGDAYRAVIGEMSRVRALREAVLSSRNALEATRAGFDAGHRTTLDVVERENGVREAETAYILGLYDYISSRLHLERAAGSLTVESLAEIGTWLE